MQLDLLSGFGNPPVRVVIGFQVRCPDVDLHFEFGVCTVSFLGLDRANIKNTKDIKTLCSKSRN